MKTETLVNLIFCLDRSCYWMTGEERKNFIKEFIRSKENDC